MPFLKDDEFIIVMNPNPFVGWVSNYPVYIPTLEDRIRFREAGIQTALEFPKWKVIEPRQGEYDFSCIDEMLALNKGADQKTILSVFGVGLPDWMPDDWMVKHENRKVDRRYLSWWNGEAQDYSDKYYKMLVDKYPDVLFIFAESDDGETLLPCDPSFYDERAIESYKNISGLSSVPDIGTPETEAWLAVFGIEKALRVQEIINIHNEIWNMQQLLMNVWSRATVNYAQIDVLKAYQKQFKDAHLVLLQYTYFDAPHYEVNNEQYVDNLQKAISCDVIVEARFCEGLKVNTPKAIAKGFRGQILCPAHPQTRHRQLEDWMFAEIGKAHTLWLG